MTDRTALDDAHAAMDAAPRDDAARLRFFERLADSELFLMLEAEAEGETIRPEIFAVADGQFVLAFDREDRLARFAGRPAPYAALSGRAIAMMLTGQGIGLAVNPEVAPSSILVPAEAVDWLCATLGEGPDEVEHRITELLPPGGVPERLLTALDAKLATAAGLAASAYLVEAAYGEGGRGHVLGIIDARPGAEPALARAVNEALTFSGIEAGALDVAFFAASDQMAARLARVGLRFDLPQPETRAEVVRPAPGSDPDKPPILR
ncbi:SseB family protein [Marinibacterium sp. SX1]|uniref:SseB family protein n=1 Tax=Marinibacterium sp. SX1 TaxID=3388424 RepID=UPI003D167014